MEPQDELFSGETEMDMLASKGGLDPEATSRQPLAARMRPRSLAEVVGQVQENYSRDWSSRITSEVCFSMVLLDAVRRALRRQSRTRRRAATFE